MINDVCKINYVNIHTSPQLNYFVSNYCDYFHKLRTCISSICITSVWGVSDLS